jgi:hypothetical protein
MGESVRIKVGFLQLRIAEKEKEITDYICRKAFLQ